MSMHPSPKHDTSHRAMPWLENLADLMDNRFRIPFTNIRFGLDAIIGLVPVAGDMVTLFISGIIVVFLAIYGASGRLVVLMLGNVLIDTLIGAIPILGDLFDLGYKANRRNVNLLKAHYDKGAHRGSGLGIVIVVIGFVIVLIGGLIWLLGKLADSVM